MTLTLRILLSIGLLFLFSCSRPQDEPDVDLAELVTLNQRLREATRPIASPQDSASLELPTMVPVPGGTFAMGSPRGDADELPVHTVSVSPLLVGATEVTQAQYESLIGANPSLFVDPDRPVENVSWEDAIAYCNALSDAQGLTRAYGLSSDSQVTLVLESNGYRLPTEAEWEWMARGGDTGPSGWTNETSGGLTHKVGLLAPNRFGLYDLVGNTWEWCWDWYGPYSDADAKDPLGPATGTYRVGRGGTWAQGSYAARTSNRVELGTPGYRNAVAGFRVVRGLPKVNS